MSFASPSMRRLRFCDIAATGGNKEDTAQFPLYQSATAFPRCSPDSREWEQFPVDSKKELERGALATKNQGGTAVLAALGLRRRFFLYGWVGDGGPLFLSHLRPSDYHAWGA